MKSMERQLYSYALQKSGGAIAPLAPAPDNMHAFPRNAMHLLFLTGFIRLN